jgi:hypothetical protein
VLATNVRFDCDGDFGNGKNLCLLFAYIEIENRLPVESAHDVCGWS